MRILLLFVMCNLAFATSKASFAKDTSFISYKEFSHLGKREVKQQFYKDEDSQGMIDSYYSYRNKGLKLLFWIIPLVAAGTFFAVTGSHATNGMAGTINAVLAVAFLLPAFLLTVKFFTKIFSKKHYYSKKALYTNLKEHFQLR